MSLDNARKRFFVHQRIDVRLGKGLFARAFILRSSIRQLLLVGIDGLLGTGKLSAGATELRCRGDGTRLHFCKLLLVSFELSRCRLRLLRKLSDLRLNLRVRPIGIDGLQRSDLRLQRSKLTGLPRNCQRQTRACLPKLIARFLLLLLQSAFLAA